MKKTIWFAVLGSMLGFAASVFAQEKYPIVWNFQFINSYEYVDAMAMSEQNKQYYAVFIVAFKNQGEIRMQVADDYEIVTSKDERHKPGFHPMVRKDVEARRKFSSETGKIGWLNPGQTKYRIAIFDVISEGTPAFKLSIHGLPDPRDPALKYQVIADYERIKGVWQLRKSERKTEQ